MPGKTGAELDPKQLSQLFKALKGFDEVLAKQLKKFMRDAGKKMAEDVRNRVLEPPPSGGGSTGIGDHDSRQKLADGIKSKFDSTGRGGMLTIMVDTAGLEGRRGFALAYNKPNFRHPVFGNRAVWTKQQGNPYLAKSDRRELEDTAKQAVIDALNAAANEMGH